MYKIKAVVVFLCLVTLVVSDCISKTNLSGIETGISTLQMQQNQLSTNNQNIEYLLYTFKPIFIFNSPQIAFGIYGLDSPNLNVDQMLLTVNSTSNGFQFKYSGKLNAWNTIKISYMVAEQTQMVLGTQNIVLNSLKGAKASNPINFSFNFNVPKANAYLNGFSLNSINLFDLNISVVSSQTKSFSIEVSVGPNMDVKNVYISYIVYDALSNFLTETGTKNLVYTGSTQYYMIQNVMPVATYMLFGLNQIGLAQNQINVQLQIDKDSILIFSSSSSFKTIGLAYTMFGRKPSSLCLNPTGNTCSSNTNKYLDGNCVEICPPNSYQQQYSDGGISCRICSSNLGLKLNEAKNGCICLDNSIPQNGVCQNSQNNMQTTASFINDGLNYGLGSNLNSFGNEGTNCQSIPHSYWNGFVCICENNYVNISNQCLPRDNNQNQNVNNNFNTNSGDNYGIGNIFNDYILNIPRIIYDSFPNDGSGSGGGSGNPSCAAYETFSNIYNKCVCIDNYYRVSGVCQICSPPNFIINQQCVQCPLNSVYNSQTKKCDCYYGYNYNSYTNNCDSQSGGGGSGGNQCGAYQTFNYQTNRCECIPNYERVGNQCIYSPPNTQTCSVFQIYNSTTRKCQDCGLNQIAVNNECKCNQGFSKVNGVCTIQCDPDQFIYQGKCARCPQNRTYNGSACACKANFIEANGLCVPNNQTNTTNCPDKQYYNNSQSKCLSCIPNCQKCSTGSNCQKCKVGFQTPLCTPPINIGNNSICGNGKLEFGEQCDDNNLINGDGCDNKCKIQPGYNCTNITGQKSVCNKTNQTAAVCGNGKIESGETCDDSNTVDGDGCTKTCKIESGYKCTGQPSKCNFTNSGYRLVQYGDAKPSTFQAIILLKTDPIFTFQSETQKRNFIKQQSIEPNTSPDRVFCNQDGSRKQIFSCLLMFNSGIPNSKFTSKFSYTKDGQSPEVLIQIEPQQINALRIFG